MISIGEKRNEKEQHHMRYMIHYLLVCPVCVYDLLTVLHRNTDTDTDTGQGQRRPQVLKESGGRARMAGWLRVRNLGLAKQNTGHTHNTQTTTQPNTQTKHTTKPLRT